MSWYWKISLGAIVMGAILIAAQYLLDPDHLLFLAAGLLLVALGGGMIWVRMHVGA